MAIGRDLGYACRSLAKARAFTFVCVVTLGIGMAPVIAIHFGMRMFTTPPPGVNTEGLVELVTRRVGPHAPSDRWAYPDFIDLRDAATGMSLTGWARGDSEVTLPASGEKRTSPAMFVSSSYFQTVGVALARGAGFAQDAADPVVILGYRFWRKRLAANPDIVGTKIVINDVPHVVTGIGPERFEGHVIIDDGIDVYLPLEQHPRLLADNNARFDRQTEWVHIHGRLSPGVGLKQASAAVAAITARLAQEHPPTNEFRTGAVAAYAPVGSLEGEDLPIVITAWHAIATLPLLVVCLNVAGMVQVRSAMRERELSIRQAIGASRRRLIQHLMAEAVVLAALGTALAFVMLFNVPSLVSWWVGEPLPVLLESALAPDVSMLAVAAGVCLAASLVFGWLPALRFSRPVIMKVLKDESGSGSIRAGIAHRLISALQIVLAVPLLILSAMSIERVRATTTADLGFASDQLYAAPIALPEPEVRGLIQTLAGADGVEAVTVADGLPLDFRYRMARVSSPAGANVAPKVAVAHVTRVGERYLDTMAIPLRRGRAFTIDDGAGAPLVTIVSRALADRLFPDADAIGRQITFGAQGDDSTPVQTLTVVGVTADFPTSQMTTAREQLLLPLAQHPDVDKDAVPVQDDRRGLKTLMLIARGKTGVPSTKLTTTLESAIRQVDRDFDRRAIDTGVALRQRSIDDFLSSFAAGGIGGGLTLCLAALGIYGVVGLMVTARTREIAVRFTLGASRPRVIGMILFDVVKLVAPGVAAGVLITVAVARLQGGVTISNIEPLAYVAGAAIATLTAVLAALAPARRAASIDPMVAMRST